MESSAVEYKIQLDAAEMESTIDRLTAKAEKLEAILDRLDSKVDALDSAENPILDSKPRFIGTINVGNLEALLKMPAGILSEEMEQSVQELAMRVLKREDANPTAFKPTAEIAHDVAKSFFKAP